MKKEEIRTYMLTQIACSLDEAIKEAEERAAEKIDDDDIYDFLWNKSFGLYIYDDYLEELEDNLKDELLEDIYESIDINEILEIIGR